MQNGLNEAVLVEHLGTAGVVGAFVNIFADVVRPGTIRDGGVGALPMFGELDGTIASERVNEIVYDLQAWRGAVATDNVLGYLWSKLGFGGMLTATALADDAMGELVDRHRPGLHAVAREVFLVAGELGIGLEGLDAFDPLAYVPGATEQDADEATNRLVEPSSNADQEPHGGVARYRRPAPADGDPCALHTRDRPRRRAPCGHARTESHARGTVSRGRTKSIEHGRRAARSPRRRRQQGSRVMDQVPGWPVDLSALRDWLLENNASMVDDVRAFVELESPSDDTQALGDAADWLEEWIIDHVGPPVSCGGRGGRRLRRHACARVAGLDGRAGARDGHCRSRGPRALRHRLATWDARRAAISNRG